MPYAKKYNLSGSNKIKNIIKEYPFPFLNFIAMDIGTSSGGFLKILLNYTANKIYTIDVGKNQLKHVFKKNIFIDNLCNIHIKNICKNYFHPKPQIVTIDISFVSLLKILKIIFSYVSKKTRLYILVKPQFEISYKLIKKSGILKNLYIKKMALLNVVYHMKIILKKFIINFCILHEKFISKNFEYWIISEC